MHMGVSQSTVYCRLPHRRITRTRRGDIVPNGGRLRRVTCSRHASPVAPNLLDQNFVATGPNEKWEADISYN